MTDFVAARRRSDHWEPDDRRNGDVSTASVAHASSLRGTVPVSYHAHNTTASHPPFKESYSLSHPTALGLSTSPFSPLALAIALGPQPKPFTQP